MPSAIHSTGNAALLFLLLAAADQQPVSARGGEAIPEYHVDALVNISRYPIDQLQAVEYGLLMNAKRTSLKETGVASFPGFLASDAVAAAADEAVRSSPTAWITDSEHNAWQTERNRSLPTTHLANLFMRTRVASVAFDEIGPTLRALYESPELLSFLSDLLGRQLFRLADPLGACSINVFRDGWDHAWHFDESEYTVTLSLQQAEEGGDFLFTTPLRTEQADLALEQVASVIREKTEYDFVTPPRPDAEGSSSSASESPQAAGDIPVRTAPFAPGTLQVFAGRYSLHAVTRTSGELERLVAVLCFATEPGVRNSPAVQQMFWGRTIGE